MFWQNSAVGRGGKRGSLPGPPAGKGARAILMVASRALQGFQGILIVVWSEFPESIAPISTLAASWPSGGPPRLHTPPPKEMGKHVLV